MRPSTRRRTAVFAVCLTGVVALYWVPTAVRTPERLGVPTAPQAAPTPAASTSPADPVGPTGTPSALPGSSATSDRNGDDGGVPVGGSAGGGSADGGSADGGSADGSARDGGTDQGPGTDPTTHPSGQGQPTRATPRDDDGARSTDAPTSAPTTRPTSGVSTQPPTDPPTSTASATAAATTSGTPSERRSTTSASATAPPPGSVHDLHLVDADYEGLVVGWAPARAASAYQVSLNGYAVGGTTGTEVALRWFNDDMSEHFVQVRAIGSDGQASREAGYLRVTRPPSPTPSVPRPTASTPPVPGGTSTRPTASASATR